MSVYDWASIADGGPTLTRHLPEAGIADAISIFNSFE